jgi:hypothetical protein
MSQDKDYMEYIEPEGEIIEPTPDLKLWNPATAVWLSLFLSPVFGAVIHAINWYKLNDLVRMTWNIIWILLVSFLLYKSFKNYPTGEYEKYPGVTLWIC